MLTALLTIYTIFRNWELESNSQLLQIIKDFLTLCIDGTRIFYPSFRPKKISPSIFPII